MFDSQDITITRSTYAALIWTNGLLVGLVIVGGALICALLSA